MKDVYIIGSCSTQFKKWPDKTYKQLTRDAYLQVLKDAGIESGNEFKCVWFGSTSMAAWQQGNIGGQVCFSPLVQEGLFPERVPIFNIESACATGSMALNGAWKDIQSGFSDISIAIGVDKIFHPDVDPQLIFKGFQNGIDQFDKEQWIKVYMDTAAKCGKKWDPEIGSHTVFMDTYAIQACYHMKKYGTTQRQIAVGASKNHYNGSLNPKAQYQFEVPVEKVLADREVSYPLTRSMCSPIGDGAAAVILCSGEYLNELPSSVQNRAVKVLATVLTGGKYRDADEPSLSKIAADQAYALSNIGPEDIDVAEIHDACSFCEIYQSEMMGFCPIGEGGKFVESGATALDGKIPINTSGGLVSKGHPIGATGLSMIYELVTQLRGEAGPRQIKNAEFALQENGGGVMGLEEAACSVIILQKDR